MADEDHVTEILVLQNIDDVGHVGLETDFGASKVAPLAKPGERGRGHDRCPPSCRSGTTFFQNQAPCHAG